jgi:hypothetical protein
MNFEEQWLWAQREFGSRGWLVIRDPVDSTRSYHETDYKNFECLEAARALRAAGVRTVLDVGSYQHFVAGLSACFDVTALDVRKLPEYFSGGYLRVVTDDIRRFSVGGHGIEQFDAVTSLSAVEHFGLGRYGDELCVDGDREGVERMFEATRPGGIVVLSTAVAAGCCTLAFNSHRTYTWKALSSMMGEHGHLESVRFFSRKRTRAPCDESEIEHSGVDPATGWSRWDVCCGSWRKVR